MKPNPNTTNKFPKEMREALRACVGALEFARRAARNRAQLTKERNRKMVSHPNRGAGKPGRNPTPEEVRAFRRAHGLSAKEAAELVYSAPRSWQQWEADDGDGARRMHPAFWMLARLAVLPEFQRLMDRLRAAGMFQDDAS